MSRWLLGRRTDTTKAADGTLWIKTLSKLSYLPLKDQKKKNVVSTV